MTKNDLRIVYMGTPEFAVEGLRALVERNYQVVAVVTMPDKPVGRHGSVLQASPVKQYAQQHNIPVLQPEKLKNEVFLSELQSFNADLQIVVAFRMLPEVVWNMPRFGTFNLHASLLPQYRGAAPINWAIINGEKETGATTFFLTHEIDTGKIIRQQKLPIAETDDAGVVHDALMALGANLVIETVDLLLQNNGNIDTIPQETLYQSETELLPAPKIFKETCHINWYQPIRNIYNFIRGLSPYPAAWTELIMSDGSIQTMKIYQSEMIYETHNLAIGSIRYDSKANFDIAAEDGFIRIISLQMAGKKRLSAKEFLNGLKQFPPMCKTNNENQ
ncbi:MAG: methionyl-tRNA formyltransferase [Tannerella sp.]|jgi:methionyl-tRNA formyltransferase|nr:methionyl-tRNA formyltransferase [Tannerella sp.]